MPLEPRHRERLIAARLDELADPLLDERLTALDGLKELLPESPDISPHLEKLARHLHSNIFKEQKAILELVTVLGTAARPLAPHLVAFIENEDPDLVVAGVFALDATGVDASDLANVVPGLKRLGDFVHWYHFVKLASKSDGDRDCLTGGLLHFLTLENVDVIGFDSVLEAFSDRSFTANIEKITAFAWRTHASAESWSEKENGDAMVEDLNDVVRIIHAKFTALALETSELPPYPAESPEESEWHKLEAANLRTEFLKDLGRFLNEREKVDRGKLERLAEALNQREHASDLINALFAIGRYGAGAVPYFPRLRELLKDPEEIIRLATLTALETLEKTAAPLMDAVKPLLKDPSRQCQILAARVLAVLQ